MTDQGHDRTRGEDPPDGGRDEQPGRSSRHEAKSAALAIDRVLSDVEQQLARQTPSPAHAQEPPATGSDVEPPTAPPVVPTTEGDHGPVPGLLESVWRYRWLVLLITVFGLLGGLLAATMQPPRYEATALLRLDESPRTGFAGQDRIDSEPYIARQVDLVRSRAVTEVALNELDGRLGPEELRRAIDVEGDAELLTVEISASGGTAEGAAEIANTVAVAYQLVAEERYRTRAQQRIQELEAAEESLQDRIAELEEQIEATDDPASPLAAARLQSLVDQLIELEGEIRSVAIDAELVGSGVSEFEEAAVPDSRAAPSPLLLSLLGLLLGGGAGVAIAYWRGGRATVVWSAEEAARILQAPLLGRLPRLRTRGEDLNEVLDIEPAEREAFDFLLTSLEYALVKAQGSALMITSAIPRQGKTTATIHLGFAAAGTERRVLLVDGDLRSRRLSDLFGMGDVPGLSELDRAAADGIAEMVKEGERRLTVVPTGQETERAAAFLHAAPFRENFRRLTRSADLVLVDSAPVLATAETTLLSSLVDGVVLLVSARSAARELRRVKERTAFMSAPLLGFVFVGGDRRGTDATYGYYGYGDRHDRGPDEPNGYVDRVRQLVSRPTRDIPHG